MKRNFGLIIIFLGFLIFFTLPSKGWAASEFSLRYRLNYEVEESGLTNVTYQVRATNLTTQYYVSEYDLVIPSTKVEGVVAADSQGIIQPQISQDEAVTKVHLVFNEKVVGKGKVLSFSLTYQTPEIARKNGRIWEITLPPKTEDPQITGYSVNLTVPSSFGPPAYLWPKPASGLTWDKEELKSGVTAAFGDFQLFAFKLKYHLSNPNFFPVYTEVALPADKAYQRVKLEEIEPAPVSLRQDEDGNWLARFDLSPGDKIDLQVSGLVKILPLPAFPSPSSKEKLSVYLTEQKFWEVNDQEIQELARILKSPEKIYQYVATTLKYNYQKAQEGGERIGAKAALKNPQNSICMEFTDLFIALARSAGIPAREVDGFAYTTDSKLRPISLEKDILHAWPEFWDEARQTWVMVDPTWGSTTGGVDYFSKLDFNHFALVTRGISSEKPHPAGAYKIDGSKGKDVEVEFSAKEWIEDFPRYETTWNLPRWGLSSLGSHGGVKIKNKGLLAAYPQEVILNSSPSGLLENKISSLILAPGESSEIELKFKKSALFDSFSGTIFLSFDGETFSHSFRIQSLGWTILLAAGGLGVLGLVIFILKKRKGPPLTNGAKNLSTTP